MSEEKTKDLPAPKKSNPQRRATIAFFACAAVATGAAMYGATDEKGAKETLAKEAHLTNIAITGKGGPFSCPSGHGLYRTKFTAVSDGTHVAGVVCEGLKGKKYHPVIKFLTPVPKS